jgi:hypothetical protein
LRCRIRPRRKRKSWVPLAVVLALTVTACDDRADAGVSDSPSAQAGAARYADEIAALDHELARAREAARRDAAFWPAYEQLARLWLDRAWLTGSFEDLAAAAAAAQAIEELGGVLASCPTGIRVNLAVHRLGAAQALVDGCEKSAMAPAGKATLSALRADLALQAGRYGDALRLSRRALDRRESPADLARLALLHEVTGAPSEALALLDRAEKLDHAGTPKLRAWLALRRGLIALHRGRWEEALAHYLAAERHLAGWWRVDEHIAEVRALLGERTVAAALYRRVLASSEEPEIMDALAVLLRELGQPDEAREWIRRAEAAHRGRLAQLPEAAAGHALTHFLEFAAADPETLALARRDVVRRGRGDTRLALVRALLATGDVDGAGEEMRRVLASGWSTAETHALAQKVFDCAGNSRAAQSEAVAAASMNPRWREQYPKLRCSAREEAER